MPSPRQLGRQEKSRGERQKWHELRSRVLSRAERPEVWARRDDLTVFDCAVAEAYYVGDTAIIDGRNAVILKVEL